MHHHWNGALTCKRSHLARSINYTTEEEMKNTDLTPMNASIEEEAHKTWIRPNPLWAYRVSLNNPTPLASLFAGMPFFR